MKFEIPAPESFVNLAKANYFVRLTPGSWRQCKLFYHHAIRVEVEAALAGVEVLCEINQMLEGTSSIAAPKNRVGRLRFGPAPIEGAVEELSVRNFYVKLGRIGVELDTDLSKAKTLASAIKRLNESTVDSLLVKGGSYNGTLMGSIVHTTRR